MQNPLTAGSSIVRNSIILGVFAMVTVGLIALTQQGTASRIAEEQRRMQMSALNEILPHDQHDNDLLEDAFGVDDRTLLNLPGEAMAYRGRMDGEVVAVILPTIAPDGEIAGVRITNHRETPGLGDKLQLNKSTWVLDFNGTSLSMPAPENWGVRKDGGDFDQFTGATITPRAVVQAVYRALQYFEANREQLLELDTEELARG